MPQVLIKSKKYTGKYVATKDFSSKKVIASGESPEEVYSKVIRKGCQNPVIFFVPLENMVQIY